MVSKGVRCMNHQGSEGGEKRKMHGQEPHGELEELAEGPWRAGSEREEIKEEA